MALALFIPVIFGELRVFAYLRWIVFAAVFVGVTQLAWLAPLTVYYWRKKEKRTVQGIVAGAAVVFLLNSACWGIMTEYVL